MHVFLGGKVDAEHGAWRDAVLGTRAHTKTYQSVPCWALYKSEHDTADEVADYDRAGVIPWPVRPTLVHGVSYVGPYRQILDPPRDLDSKYSGYFHGVEAWGQHGVLEGRDIILKECLAAITRADMLFCVINRPDCYGTLAEIGWARAHGKFVYVFIDDSGAVEDWEEYWYVHGLCGSETMPRRKYAHYLAAPLTPLPILDIFHNALACFAAGYTTPAHPASPLHQSVGAIAQWTSDPRARKAALQALKRGEGTN